MIVDRIEGRIAVIELEDGSHIDVPLSKLPEGTREGSVLRKKSGGFELDPRQERERRKKAAERTKRLFG